MRDAVRVLWGGGWSPAGALMDAFVHGGRACVKWALWPSDGASVLRPLTGQALAELRVQLPPSDDADGSSVRWWRATGGLLNGSIAPATTRSAAPPRSPPLPTAAHARPPYHALQRRGLAGRATAQLSRDVAAVRLGGAGHVGAWIASALSLPVRCAMCSRSLPAQTTRKNTGVVCTPNHRTVRFVCIVRRSLIRALTPPVRR